MKITSWEANFFKKKRNKIWSWYWGKNIKLPLPVISYSQYEELVYMQSYHYFLCDTISSYSFPRWIIDLYSQQHFSGKVQQNLQWLFTTNKILVLDIPQGQATWQYPDILSINSHPCQVQDWWLFFYHGIPYSDDGRKPRNGGDWPLAKIIPWMYSSIIFWLNNLALPILNFWR